VAYIKQSMQLTHHQIGNIIIDLRGDQAFTETYCTAYHKSLPTPESNRFMLGEDATARLDNEHGSNDLLIGLRYLDRFDRIDGKWRIGARRLVYDWSMMGQSSGLTEGLYVSSTLRGARKPDDPSYNDYGIGAADL
jgi:hypothetical protein